VIWNGTVLSSLWMKMLHSSCLDALCGVVVLPLKMVESCDTAHVLHAGASIRHDVRMNLLCIIDAMLVIFVSSG